MAQAEASRVGAPSGTGKIYPLISQEQAEQKLRKGEFFTVNPYDKDVAETAQVLSVELEYLCPSQGSL